MNSSMYDVIWANQAFSAAQCDAILGKYAGSPLQPGVLMQQSAPDLAARKSAVRFVPVNDEDAWIFNRLRDVAVLANQRFGFDLKDFEHGFQLGRYAEGEFYHWHADLGADVSALRKLSLVVQLTDPADYEGGELEFFPQPITAPRERGTVIAFPSYIPHRVIPVTRGQRHSIAAWIVGEKPFR